MVSAVITVIENFEVANEVHMWHANRWRGKKINIKKIYFAFKNDKSAF